MKLLLRNVGVKNPAIEWIDSNDGIDETAFQCVPHLKKIDLGPVHAPKV